MKTYKEKLRDPRWLRKREEIIKEAGFRCEDCGSGRGGFEVHHCAYLPQREPWEYDSRYLMCLCPACHEKRQKAEDTIRATTALMCRKMTPASLTGFLEWHVREVSLNGYTEHLNEAATTSMLAEDRVSRIA